MTAALETPFTIGQQMWLAVGDTENVKVTCPVCAGALGVTVTLGSGEQVGVMCDACGLGFDGPRGYITEWEHRPRAVPFVIASVKSFRDGKWEVLSTEGWSYFHKLHQTEAEALAAAQQQAAQQHENNMLSRQRQKSSVRRLTWSVRYHNDCIKDLQRQIDWHQARVMSGRVKKQKAVIDGE